jgi:hypothetical protein
MWIEGKVKPTMYISKINVMGSNHTNRNHTHYLRLMFFHDLFKNILGIFSTYHFNFIFKIFKVLLILLC